MTHGRHDLQRSLNGKPVKQDWIYRRFKVACKRAGIVDFRFHDLRHDCGSQLAMRGVDTYAIKEVLRHKTIQMTMRYAHLSPEHKLRAVDALDGGEVDH